MFFCCKKIYNPMAFYCPLVLKFKPEYDMIHDDMQNDSGYAEKDKTMKRIKIVKTVIGIVAGVLVLVLALDAVQRVLTPKYVSTAQDGRLVAEYYDSAKNHDVVFVGDCEIYENISPVTLWQEYGISSYMRGSPQQLIWHSYYMMKDTLRHEKPKAFVYNVYSMKYSEPQKEEYNRMALDGMEWSSVKAEAVKASMMKKESFMSYVFPLLRYHDRWSQLTAEDFKYAYQDVPQLSINGYLMRIDVKGVSKLYGATEGTEKGPIQPICWEYLDKMRQLCEENGVQFILMKAPTNTPIYHWYASWEKSVEEYAAKHNLPYYNFLEVTEEIGLNYKEDTYDQGAHLNLFGAEKLAKYFGRILQEDLGIAGHKGDAAYEAIWADLTEKYYRIKATQEKLIKENGKLTGFTGLE